MGHYEEHTHLNTFKSWLVIFLISGSLLGWAMLMMTFVEDGPRNWNYGSLNLTPSESVYSTNREVSETGEKMIAPLPEGISMEEEKDPE